MIRLIIVKKFLLSASVLGVFAVYAIHTNIGGGDEGTPIVAVNTPLATATPGTSVTSQITSGSTGPTPALTSSGKYKDGTYTGSVADAFYGNIQVQVTISGGRITNVVFLQFPNDRSTSRMINAQADPMLAQEAIQVQSAQVSGVSGATASSSAFVQSLQSALSQAT